MAQQQQSREFEVSDLSSIPWLGKRRKNQLNISRDFKSRGKGCLTWSCKGLKITEGVERFSKQDAPTISKGFPTNLEHY